MLTTSPIRYFLHPSLHRDISEGRLEDDHAGGAATGGEDDDDDVDVIFMSQVLTKDSVTVSVDAVVYYRVSNATVSVANVEDAHSSTRLLAQTTLRNILGTKDLYEILSDRESISGSMQAVLDEATGNWGIKVHTFRQAVSC